MTRQDELRRLAAVRREYAADALRCEEEADGADPCAAALWRDRADCWWRLTAQAAVEYERILAKTDRPVCFHHTGGTSCSD